jgi:hypothetical protein
MAFRMLPQIARVARHAKSNAFSARGFVSVTSPVLEKHTMKVPSMGDSITEVRVVDS